MHALGTAWIIGSAVFVCYVWLPDSFGGSQQKHTHRRARSSTLPHRQNHRKLKNGTCFGVSTWLLLVHLLQTRARAINSAPLLDIFSHFWKKQISLAKNEKLFPFTWKVAQRGETRARAIRDTGFIMLDNHSMMAPFKCSHFLHIITFFKIFSS